MRCIQSRAAKAKRIDKIQRKESREARGGGGKFQKRIGTKNQRDWHKGQGQEETDEGLLRCLQNTVQFQFSVPKLHHRILRQLRKKF
jgi:hypothetical protein